MKICFTLDEVLRAKIDAFEKYYQKSQDESFKLEKKTSFDVKDLFKFKTKNGINKFMYEDYVFEIFGEAETCTPFLDKTFNLWLLNITENNDDYDDIEVMFANPKEFNASIGCTYFFLSKIASRVREVFLPKDSSEIWGKCDVLVTADPKLLKEKPEGKISVKINGDFNVDDTADFNYDTLADLLKDSDFCKKIHGVK